MPRSRTKVLVLAVGISAACAAGTAETRLGRSALRERCDVIARAARFKYQFDPRITPSSIPEGECARELAASSGKLALRVQEERMSSGGAIRRPFFRAGERCSWPDLELVDPDFDRVDKAVSAVVTVLMFAEERDGVPFRVGVEMREGDKERGVIWTSPCGVVDGRIEWSAGGWRAESVPRGVTTSIEKSRRAIKALNPTGAARPRVNARPFD